MLSSGPYAGKGVYGIPIDGRSTNANAEAACVACAGRTWKDGGGMVRRRLWDLRHERGEGPPADGAAASGNGGGRNNDRRRR